MEVEAGASLKLAVVSLLRSFRLFGSFLTPMGSADNLDTSAIIGGGRRTRGKQIDFKAALKDMPADSDSDEE